MSPKFCKIGKKRAEISIASGRVDPSALLLTQDFVTAEIFDWWWCSYQEKDLVGGVLIQIRSQGHGKHDKNALAGSYAWVLWFYTVFCTCRIWHGPLNDPDSSVDA